MAGQSLAWIAVITTMFYFIPGLPWHLVRIGMFGLLSTFFVVSTVKWYPASWYLANGEKLSVLVKQAKIDCSNENVEFAKLKLLLAETELSCSKFLSGH